MIKCIMLIDDNIHDNFFHERTIRKCNAAEEIVIKESGEEALEYLRALPNSDKARPDLIFLDINMPGMNGWEFLEEYEKLEKKFQAEAVVVMLTTSENPRDKEKAQKFNMVKEYGTKPLTDELLLKILSKYFPEHK